MPSSLENFQANYLGSFTFFSKKDIIFEPHMLTVVSFPVPAVGSLLSLGDHPDRISISKGGQHQKHFPARIYRESRNSSDPGTALHKTFVDGREL